MKRQIMKNHAVLVAISALALTALAFGQDKSQRPSPPAQAECKFADGKSITVDYSSPRAKGRKVFGGLVPFDQVWRTGANEATSFVTDAGLKVGGQSIPAGSYTIFTVPGSAKWKLIVNKKTGQWGIPYKWESEELLRTDMQLSKVPAPVENFTISFDQSGPTCTMKVTWENTQAAATFAEGK
jgi:Protein of unknown function (DUF2911)